MNTSRPTDAEPFVPRSEFRVPSSDAMPHSTTAALSRLAARDPRAVLGVIAYWLAKAERDEDAHVVA